MGQDDRPEREPSGADEDTPEDAPREDPYGGPPDEPEEEPRRSLFLRAVVVLGGIALVALLLVGWNRVASSDAFCASCHEVKDPAAAAARSVHADVACISCHTGPGLAGAIRYLPTLARETIDEFTGWDIAHGVLDARSCVTCHANIADTPELAAAHTTGADCSTCHGDVAHPPFRLAGFARPVEPVSGEDPHPALYVQTHGEDVANGFDTCVECHDTKFCEACHFRSNYPHPKGWIQIHGPTQIQEGPDACTQCHPQTFCAGCHGTEIPHDARWLGEHWRDLEDAPVTPCLLCHPRTDCTTCHSEHSVHQSQDLYVRSPS